MHKYSIAFQSTKPFVDWSQNVKMDVENILVTGASRGLGLELALELSRCGVRTYAILRSENCKGYGILLSEGVEVVIADLSDRKALNGAIESILEKEKTLDAVISNGAIIDSAEIENLSEDEILNIISVNFIAPLFLATLPVKHISNPFRFIQIGGEVEPVQCQVIQSMPAQSLEY